MFIELSLKVYQQRKACWYTGKPCVSALPGQVYHLYRLIKESNQDSLSTVHGPLLKLTQNLWYTWYKYSAKAKIPAGVGVSGVPQGTKTAGTLVVHPVHLGCRHVNHVQPNAYQQASSDKLMIVIIRDDDSSTHVPFSLLLKKDWI